MAAICAVVKPVMLVEVIAAKSEVSIATICVVVIAANWVVNKALTWVVPSPAT